MPDVPKHAWTHRPKAQGGTDPIPTEVAPTPVGIMLSGQTSRTTSSKLYIPMDLFWTNNTAVFGYADVTAAAAKFMTISEPGVYRAVGHIGTPTGSPFTVGDNPQFVFSTEFGGVDGDLVPGLNEYYDDCSTSVEGIWNSLFTAEAIEHRGMRGEVIFNFSEANWGESPIKIGVAVYSDNSRTLPFFAQLAVYQVSTALMEFEAIS